MHSAQVLTHPAFDRPAVGNARRRGPTPSDVPMLSRVRRSRRDEEASLRAWAREHANAHWTLDQVRREKQRREATEVLETRRDEIWLAIEQLLDDLAELRGEAWRLQELLVQRQLVEQFGPRGRRE